MQAKLDQVLSEVLESVTPKSGDRAKIKRVTNWLEKRVKLACEKEHIKAIVRAEGSVAKDTWLREEPDVDVFMRVSREIPRDRLGEATLKVAKRALRGRRQVERFAEHPYLEGFVDGVRVNVVPCYDTVKGEWLSATDRTPFHTDYVRANLSEGMKGQVRLVKRFLKGIGAYGAEIKVGGFSGYLCELLILHYGSFVGVLNAFAEYNHRLVVDIERYYANRMGEVEVLFEQPLVVVDPVDEGRNVASAVQGAKLFSFVAAARAFLKEPKKLFFFSPKMRAFRVAGLRRLRVGRDFVFVVFGRVDAVPDVLWGQLYKSHRSLRRLVEINDFRLMRSGAWSDENGLNVLVFEVESRCLSLIRKHLGPPIERVRECESFLAKYVGNGVGVVSGPFVEDGRWVVEVKRKETDLVGLLRSRLRDGGKNAGVADKISRVLAKKGFEVLVNDEVAKIYGKNKGFAIFLSDLLVGKPKWLDAEDG
jgi:tRNA nucleotidyltransferase (CCA-adding enzyme)